MRESVRSTCRRSSPAASLINGGARTVRVPVRMLEHYHFRLRRPRSSRAPARARPSPATCLPILRDSAARARRAPGGQDDGEVQLLLEFKVDDIVDWLWEEMQLPNLKARVGPSEETDWMREGWDRRGARSRLDRRRSFKELVKRRGAPGATPTFTDEDLRFRQLARRRQPAIHAVVFFLLDVSGSMSDRDRKLAKTFFFWVVQGLRREYRSLETVFVAHTTEAWEFTEAGLLPGERHRRHGGLDRLRQGARDHRRALQPGRCNIYLFYASDGDNSVSDAADAREALATIAADACFTGYVEVSSGLSRQLATETGTPVRRAVAPRAARPAATRSMISTTSGARCGTSSPAESAARRAAVRHSMSDDWQSYVRRIEELAAHSGLKFHPVDFEAVPDTLHDGDRRLRPAGAHAALVVRGALHLSAHPAPHGPLAAVRGGVSRQSRACLPRRRAMGWRRTFW